MVPSGEALGFTTERKEPLWFRRHQCGPVSFGAPATTAARKEDA